MRLHRSVAGLVLLLLCAPLGAQSLRWFQTGQYSNAFYGYALAGAGDVDGDGHEDVLIGDPSAQPGPFAPGQVWVHSGIDGTLLYTYAGDTATVGIGLDVAGVGDVNSDGHADFLFTSAEDFAEVHSGATGGLLRVVTPVSTLNQTACNVGDLDGDGRAEIAFGTPYHSSHRGRIWVVRGSWIATGGGSSLLFTVDGSDSGGWLGYDVAPGGDVDADGVPDIVAGAPYEEGTGYEGAVYVISGASGALLHHLQNPPSDSSFGTAVDSAGDVDSDGRADILVGDFTADIGTTNSGRVVVFSGADGSILHEFSEDSSDFLGRAVAGNFDVNGDHRPDLFLGANIDECNGGTRGTVRIVDGESGVQSELLCGETNGSTFGSSIARVGDVNGDGLDDFLVAAPGWNGFGRVYLYDSVCAGSIESYCAATTNSSGQAGEIEALGSTSIVQNDLTLRARLCPPGQVGIFYYGSGKTHVFIGDGYRCVAGSTFRLNPPAQINQQGRTTRVLDFTAPPLGSGAGEVVAGSSWNFQFWFRDPMGAGGGFNYTDALTIVFCR